MWITKIPNDSEAINQTEHMICVRMANNEGKANRRQDFQNTSRSHCLKHRLPLT